MESKQLPKLTKPKPMYLSSSSLAMLTWAETKLDLIITQAVIKKKKLKYAQ